MVMPPFFAKERRPTGNIRFRCGFRRRIVLQIEIEVEIRPGHSEHPIRTELRWRDADPEDLQYLEFRPALVHLGWIAP
jgi:hypothetical protein